MDTCVCPSGLSCFGGALVGHWGLGLKLFGWDGVMLCGVVVLYSFRGMPWHRRAWDVMSLAWHGVVNLGRVG